MMSCRSFESLQDLLHAARDIVMFLADDFGRQGARRRGQWVDRRIDPELGDRPIENEGRIQVGERRGRSRVGQIIGRDVHGLKRRDRTLLRRRDAFLKRAHLRGEGGLVSDGAGGAAEQRRHF
jgi:hypothetical protein